MQQIYNMHSTNSCDCGSLICKRQIADPYFAPTLVVENTTFLTSPESPADPEVASTLNVENTTFLTSPESPVYTQTFLVSPESPIYTQSFLEEENTQRFLEEEENKENICPIPMDLSPDDAGPGNPEVEVVKSNVGSEQPEVEVIKVVKKDEEGGCKPPVIDIDDSESSDSEDEKPEVFAQHRRKVRRHAGRSDGNCEAEVEAARYKNLFFEKLKLLTDNNMERSEAIAKIYFEEIEAFL